MAHSLVEAELDGAGWDGVLGALSGGSVVGVGIDLVRVERVSQALSRHGTRWLSHVFTQRESDACAGRADHVLALAARFAAKEACMKALGTGWAAGVSFAQIEVLRDPGEPPRLVLSGAAADRAAALSVRRIHVSLTHEATLAGSIVILER